MFINGKLDNSFIFKFQILCLNVQCSICDGGIVLDHRYKHLKVCQKFSTVQHIFNCTLGVWKSGETRSGQNLVSPSCQLSIRML